MRQDDSAVDTANEARALEGAVNLLLQGNFGSGRALLRTYIKSTVGFERLATESGTPAKSLHRMFGPKGNPNSNNLFRIIATLRRLRRVRLEVRATRG